MAQGLQREDMSNAKVLRNETFHVNDFLTESKADDARSRLISEFPTMLNKDPICRKDRFVFTLIQNIPKAVLLVRFGDERMDEETSPNMLLN